MYHYSSGDFDSMNAMEMKGVRVDCDTSRFIPVGEKHAHAE